MSSENKTGTITLVKDAQTVSMSTTINITNSDLMLKKVGIKYMIVDSTVDLPDTIAKTDTESSNLSETVDAVGESSKKIGVYAYVYDPSDNNKTPNDSYTLQYTFNVNFVETAFASNDTKFFDTEYKEEATEVKAEMDRRLLERI